MKYKIITAVTAEPITSAEAIKYARTGTLDAEDTALLTDIIKAAREYCENKTGLALATQTIEALPEQFGFKNYIKLPCPPLQCVTSIKYTDSAGTETTMTAGTDYIVDADSDTGRIVLPYRKTWPCFTPYPSNPIRIRYIAGFYTSNLIPNAIKQAMYMLISYWWDKRSAVLIGSISKELEFAVSALLSQYKYRWWD